MMLQVNCVHRVYRKDLVFLWLVIVLALDSPMHSISQLLRCLPLLINEFDRNALHISELLVSVLAKLRIKILELPSPILLGKFLNRSTEYLWIERI